MSRKVRSPYGVYSRPLSKEGDENFDRIFRPLVVDALESDAKRNLEAAKKNMEGFIKENERSKPQ